MALKAGTKLGPYEILAPLGAGGMGEVYRASDTRLERTVAIKVLPEQFSKDTELKQRFEREAKTISSLNHPHICTLYDVGHQDGIDYLVMEYIDGESLAQRLLKGPLSTDQMLNIGGTLEYMSPEQVEGREADPRSDIFALGAVLYEMATGKRAFEGKSTISVASAILEKDPEPISKIQPMSPPAFEHVVKTCLAKE